MPEKHSYLWDLNKPGDRGFKRLDRDGKEELRTDKKLEIPHLSKMGQTHQKFLDSKEKKWKR